MAAVQAIARPFNYAIVDEADSVLIDDCITPLIMSSAFDKVTKERYIIAQKVRYPRRMVPTFLVHSCEVVLGFLRTLCMHF